MKRIIWLLPLFLVACTSSVPDGTYGNRAESEYSIAWTTLTIKKATAHAKDLYEIRRVKFQRKLSGNQLGLLQEKDEVMTARYDAENRALYTDLPEPFVLSDDEERITITGVVYKKIE